MTTLTCGHCGWADHARCATRHQLDCACAEAGHELDYDTAALYQTPHLFQSVQPTKRYRIRVTPITAPVVSK